MTPGKVKIGEKSPEKKFEFFHAPILKKNQHLVGYICLILKTKSNYEFVLKLILRL